MSDEVAVVEAKVPAPVVMELSVEQVRGRSLKLQEIMKEVMVEGQHYGTIPGTPKPTLYSSGADILNRTFLFRPEFEILEHQIDQAAEPTLIRYMVRCKLVHIPTGNVVAEGLGSCNSHEVKYKYRGFDATDTGNPVPKGYWDLRNTDAKAAINILGGPGFIPKKNDDNQWTIHEKGKRTVNEEVEDLDNTLLKMACKRAKVGAVHHGTACGDSFTQDLEDMGDFDTAPITYGHDKEAGATAPEPEKKEPPKTRGKAKPKVDPTQAASPPTTTTEKETESPTKGETGPTPAQVTEEGEAKPPPTPEPAGKPPEATPDARSVGTDDEPPLDVYDKAGQEVADKQKDAPATGERKFDHLPKNVRAFQKVIASKAKFGITLEHVESKWGSIEAWTQTAMKEIAELLGKIKNHDEAANVIENLELEQATEPAVAPTGGSDIMVEGPDGKHYAVTVDGLADPDTGELTYPVKPLLEKIEILRSAINNLGGEGSDSFYMDGAPKDLRTLSYNELAAIHDALDEALSSLQEE